ncbi:hypothetical protein BCD67_10875 [Oscillatoriales cyanobacterium USR001]|nr:hypothetical protein BCD67_10875 [Oscillatoriales cyanobacterium USR001]
MPLDIINAFVYLLQNERHIFKESEAKLSDFSTTLPDNVEQIANNIIAWCKEQGIYDNLCNALAILTRVAGKPNNLTAKECQDLIKNATRTEPKENDNPPPSDRNPNEPA